MHNLEYKLNQVRTLLRDQGLDAAVFTTQHNFAWVTGGADNHVGITTEAGNASVVVTLDRAVVFADNIEAARVLDEEVGALGLEVIAYPWWEGGLEARITAWVGSKNWKADTPMGSRGSIEGSMYPLRSVFTDEELANYRLLGKLTGLALQYASEFVEIGATEHQIAGRLAEYLVSRGVTTNVILVAADERINLYRHPIPTDKPVQKVCMLVVGARWKGLVCSCTRMVHFGKLPESLEEKHRQVCAVEAAFLSHTLPGESVGDAMQAGLAAYAAVGYPDEWQLHHQGGPTGYKGREFRALPDSDLAIAPNQPFAWNPTITGAKSEDTVLAKEPFPEILTITPDWPTIELDSPIGPIQRPGILVK